MITWLMWHKNEDYSETLGHQIRLYTTAFLKKENSELKMEVAIPIILLLSEHEQGRNVTYWKLEDCT